MRTKTASIWRGWLALLVVFYLAVGVSPATAGDGPPPKPVLVADDSEGLGLVLMVGSGAGQAEGELDRAEKLFNATLGKGTPITILTTDIEKAKVEILFKGKGRVQIVEIEGGLEVFGNGFPRDNLPLPIRSTDAAGNKSRKYLVDEPALGPKLTDALVKAGVIPAGDVIKVPFHFEGGDIVFGDGFLFLTDKFYARNMNRKNLTAEQVNAFIKQYFGVDPGKIVKLTSPPSEGSGHSDLLVRLLPGGKIVVSVGSDDMAPEDKAALEANRIAVEEKVGQANTVPVKTKTKDPASSYANGVVSGNTVLIPQLGPEDDPADKAAKEAIEAVLPAHFGVKYVQSFDQCGVNGKKGGPHCRIGNLTVKSARTNSAGAHKSPTIDFDAPTGTLAMTMESLNLLAGADSERQDTTDPLWRNDALRNGEVFLELSALQLEPLRLDPTIASFSSGHVRLLFEGQTLFKATLPALRFWREMDAGFLDIFGILEDPVFNNLIGSAFLDDFQARVLQSRYFLDFYMLSPRDVFVLSNNFTGSFSQELMGAGISLNGNVRTVPEPATVWLIALAALLASRRSHARFIRGGRAS